MSDILYFSVGARRYAVLDFGRPIVLTDVYIPACSDLTSLSVDIWTQGEEVDGQRLAVAMDIESRDLVLNDLLPPPVCRYLKVSFSALLWQKAAMNKSEFFL